MPRGLKRFQTAHFELSDWLGTRRVLTDYAGNVQESCDSLPYGNGETCTPAPTEHLFTGKERDPETGGTNGNDYFGARYYANSAGRWLTPDPGWFKAVDLSNPQSWNLNSYVLNNPLRFIDPTGMDCTITSPVNGASTGSYADPSAADEAACEKEGGVWGTPGLGSAGPLTLGKDGNYYRTVFSKPYNPGCSGSYQCEQGYNSMMQFSLPYQPQLQLAPNNGTNLGKILKCASKTANQFSIAGIMGITESHSVGATIGTAFLGNTFSGIVDTGTHILTGHFGAAYGDVALGGYAQGLALGPNAPVAAQGVVGVVTNAGVDAALGEGMAGPVGWAKLGIDAATFLGSALYCASN